MAVIGLTEVVTEPVEPNSSGIVLAGESNTGLVMPKNEDNYCIISWPGQRAALAVICDGVGGHNHGELASLICCRDLARAFLAGESGCPESPLTAEKFLYDSMRKINRKIFQRNFREEQKRPMASTLISAIFLPETVVMGAAGDSRLYELEPGGHLRQLSIDHTLAVEFIREFGYELPPELRSEQSASISRSVGTLPELNLEVMVFARCPGSRYLLCSDGLYRFVTDDQIAKVLRETTDPHGAVDRLMRAALLNGGRDNITIIVGFPK